MKQGVVANWQLLRKKRASIEKKNPWGERMTYQEIQYLERIGKRSWKILY